MQGALCALWIEESSRELFDFLREVHMLGIELCFELVDDVGISDAFKLRGAIVRLERLKNLFGIVYEVEDERVLFSRIDAIETGERLYRQDSRQTLVDVHRM